MGANLTVRNPRSGEFDYAFPLPDEETLAARVHGLRAAQPDWQALGVKGRISVMLEFAAALEKHADAMVAALSRDTGRLSETVMETNGVVGAIRRWCEQAPGLLQDSDNATGIPFLTARQRSAPYPLVAVIAPWNFPLLLSFVDTIPALLAGCAAMVKPSELTPRFVVPLEATLAEVPVLAGVLGFVCGDGGVGAALIEQADIVCFTGSVKTGRRVAETAARNFIPAHLELGGKDPAIVTASAGLRRAAAAINWGGLVNAGQSCLSIERVYVDASVHDEFLGYLEEFTRAVTQNIDAIGEGAIGPVISLDQVDIIRRHLDDAVARGARVICGGELIEAGGVWCQPTVLADVTHDMLVMTEESFAPILPVMAFDSEVQAIGLANDSVYGLSAAVFSGTVDAAQRIAAQLDAGAISINDAALTAMVHDGEKQAFKASGLGGSRMGGVSIRRFVRSKVLIANDANVWDPWWFAQEDTGGKF